MPPSRQEPLCTGVPREAHKAGRACPARPTGASLLCELGHQIAVDLQELAQDALGGINVIDHGVE